MVDLDDDGEADLYISLVDASAQLVSLNGGGEGPTSGDIAGPPPTSNTHDAVRRIETRLVLKKYTITWPLQGETCSHKKWAVRIILVAVNWKVRIKVPPTAKAGDLLKFKLPDGRDAEIAVPAGAAGGSTLEVRVPKPPAGLSSAGSSRHHATPVADGSSSSSSSSSSGGNGGSAPAGTKDVTILLPPHAVPGMQVAMGDLSRPLPSILSSLFILGNLSPLPPF
jgi:hypothetical protein